MGRVTSISLGLGALLRVGGSCGVCSARPRPSAYTREFRKLACVGTGPRPHRVCRQWGFRAQALGFLSVGNGVFVVAALGFLSVGNGVFVFAALVFLWVVALGFAELSAPAPVFFSGKKSGALAKPLIWFLLPQRPRFIAMQRASIAATPSSAAILAYESCKRTRFVLLDFRPLTTVFMCRPA